MTLGKKGDVGTLVQGANSTVLLAGKLGVQVGLSLSGEAQLSGANWEVGISTTFALPKASLYKADNYIMLRASGGEVGISLDKQGGIKLFFTFGSLVPSFELHLKVLYLLLSSVC